MDKRKLKKKVKVVDSLAVVEKTGEVVEGVEIIERPEEFKVKVK